MTTQELSDAKRALDGARTKVRTVMVGSAVGAAAGKGGLDREDRDYLQSAMVAIDWVRGKLDEAVRDASGDAPMPRPADLLVRKTAPR